MPTFEEIFTGYGGDYPATKERFMNQPRLYLKFLDMLFDDKSLENLGRALERHDLDAAFDAAHTLKGVTGNLGLTPLYETVCVMVEPLRRRDASVDYASLYQTLQTRFQAVITLHQQLKEASDLPN